MIKLIGLLGYALLVNVNKRIMNMVANHNGRRVLDAQKMPAPVESGKAKSRTGKVADHTRGWDNFATALQSGLDPVVQALDYTDELHASASADTGATKRSVTDMSIRVEFGTIMSFYDRQLNGPIITNKKDKNGNIIGTQEYPAAREMLQRSEEALGKIRADMDDPNLSITGQIRLQAEFEKQIYWFNVNEAKVTRYSDILSSMQAVYRSITNEDWAPMPRSKAENQLSKLPEADRLQKLAEAKASMDKLLARRHVA